MSLTPGNKQSEDLSPPSWVAISKAMLSKVRKAGVLVGMECLRVRG